MEITRDHVDSLRVTFDSGVGIDVDLRSVEMSDRQRAALDKLVTRLPRSDFAECREGHCPAEAVLEPAEFDAVRQLKVQLGEGGVAPMAGPIIDFCLHVINVGREASPIEGGPG